MRRLERAQGALLVARDRGRAGLARMMRSGAGRAVAGLPAAATLLLVPTDLRTADASFAHELAEGYFGLGGAVALTGTESPFDVKPPSAAWLEELYRFSWLNHLQAAGDEIALARARGLTADWRAAAARAEPVAYRPDIAADRLTALLSHAGFLLERCTPDFYDTVMAIITREAHAVAVGAGLARGVPRLKALISLVLSGLCVSEHALAVPAHLPAFCTELDRQILPDGGHISRNPQALLDLALDLLPLRSCFLSRGQEPPEALASALARLMPMLRYLRLGDGSLTRVHGMGATRADLIAAVLAHDDQPVPATAPDSRIFRLARGAVVVLADGGGPPPPAFGAGAHTGCLAFEMSDGTAPLIVNCGAARHSSSRWAHGGRTTPAHSTLTVNDTSSARFVPRSSPLWPFRTLVPTRLPGVEARQEESGADSVFTASHGGFLEKFGLVHGRVLRLAENGDRMDGLDRIDAPAGGRFVATAGDLFAIRFHLHPRVTVTRAAGGGLALTLTSAAGWRFEAQGAQVEVEESVFLADPVIERRGLQIVLSGPCAAHIQVTWSLTRIAPAQPRRPILPA